jgi:hypothetical protein
MSTESRGPGARAATERAQAPDKADAWLPIETAPKGRTRIQLWTRGRAGYGYWEDDRYGRPPRPYWANENLALNGKLYMRAAQPTHWKPEPAPPEDAS